MVLQKFEASKLTFDKARLLQQMGFLQESLYYWVAGYKDGKAWKEHCDKKGMKQYKAEAALRNETIEIYSAYTCIELWDMLEKSKRFKKSLREFDGVAQLEDALADELILILRGHIQQEKNGQRNGHQAKIRQPSKAITAS